MEELSSSNSARLDAADVHVWTLPLEQPSAVLGALSRSLSRDEIERAERFHFQCDTDSFIAARGGLRAILGAYLYVTPASIEFTYGPQGKPELAPGGQDVDLRFNLSHAHKHALVALTRGRAIGVDIERMKPFSEVADVARTIFSDRELAEFRRLPEASKSAAFFNAWSRKEAFVKATGLGFSMSVKEVEVSFAPEEAARLITLSGSQGSADKWTLRDLGAPASYRAAFAVAGSVRQVVHREWQPDG